MSPINLAGKVAIVTGAASGIGRASALRSAGEGARVVVVDRAAVVVDTAQAIQAAGGEAHAIAADAGNEADVAAMVNDACRRFGGLDVFFANAGIIGPVPGDYLWRLTRRVDGGAAGQSGRTLPGCAAQFTPASSSEAAARFSARLLWRACEPVEGRRLIRLRNLSRAYRAGDDAADVRSCSGRGQGGQAR